jgi:hypothetical protein
MRCASSLGKAILRRLGPDRKHDIGTGEPGLHRFAKRSGRKHATIAEAAVGIHDHDRKIVGEHGVLETVVEQDDIGASPGGGARARKPVLGHPGLREGGEKQRFVAGVGRAVTKFFYQNGPRQRPAMPACDHVDRKAPVPRAAAPARWSSGSCRCRPH